VVLALPLYADITTITSTKELKKSNHKAGTLYYPETVFKSFFQNDSSCSVVCPEHIIILIYSGELIVEQGSARESLKKGECVFIRRNHLIRLTRQDHGEEQFCGVFLGFCRPFLKAFYREYNKRTVLPTVEKFESAVIRLVQTPYLKSLFFSMQPYLNRRINPAKAILEIKLCEGIYSLLQMEKKFYPCLFESCRIVVNVKLNNWILLN
jgi:hypothetical protein